MAVPTLSPPGRVNDVLRELNASGRDFVGIARELGATIGVGGFSEWLNGKREFNRQTEEKLLRILAQMQELQHAIYLAEDPDGNRLGFFQPDWSNAPVIAGALISRLMSKLANEEFDVDRQKEFSQLAYEATANTKKQ